MIRRYLTLGILSFGAAAFVGCKESSVPTSPATKPAIASEREPHDHVEMPDKLGTEEQKKIFLTPGGLYTEADIEANGRAIADIKYRGIKSEHSTMAKKGDKICPISETKANPKFTWVIGGKTYQFCCVPCIEEFVGKAKTTPGEIKPPDAYLKN